MLKTTARTGVAAAAAVVAISPAAHADSRATVIWHWENIRTGDPTFLEPGDSARIWLDVEYEPAVGSAIQTNSGPGVLGGFLALNMRVVASGGSAGTWSDVQRSQPWALGQFEAQPSGDITRWEAGAFLFPNMPHPDPANPVQRLTSAVWTPDDYSFQWVEFRGERLGTGLSLAGQLPGGSWSAHQIDEMNIDWGFVRIVIPSPAGLVLLGVGGTVLAGRRRR